MKKIILILVLGVIALSCKKEVENCSCGIITNDGASGGYWLEIQNTCSENYKTFYFDYDTWSTHFVGESFCLTNEEPW